MTAENIANLTIVLLSMIFGAVWLCLVVLIKIKEILEKKP